MIAGLWWFVGFVGGFEFLWAIWIWIFLSTLVVMVGGWLLVLAVDYGLMVVVVVFGCWMASLM